MDSKFHSWPAILKEVQAWPEHSGLRTKIRTEPKDYDKRLRNFEQYRDLLQSSNIGEEPRKTQPEDECNHVLKEYTY